MERLPRQHSRDSPFRNNPPMSTRSLSLGTAKAPTRKDKVWEIEFAPITRMDAWSCADQGR